MKFFTKTSKFQNNLCLYKKKLKKLFIRVYFSRPLKFKLATAIRFRMGEPFIPRKGTKAEKTCPHEKGFITFNGFEHVFDRKTFICRTFLGK
jgi:hypothetical protein